MTDDEGVADPASSPADDPPRGGDHDEFEAWVTARAPGLLRFAYLMTGSPDAAEEALQTALTKACEKWGHVRTLADRDAYVRRMIVNAHVSWWRKFRRRESPVADVRPSGIGDDHAGRLSDTDLVWRLCQALPAQQRASVVLRFYEDLSHREIAVQLGCAEATARSHVHRALATLRTMIGQETDDG